jgi:outer membrane murein-binding lipoprotein Lpp
MGWLSSILRVLAPIAVEHGGQVLRDSIKSRAAQGQAQQEVPSGPDPVQLLAADVDQLKGYALQLKSDIEALNNTAAEREERLRRWLLALLVWNIVITVGLVVIAVIALRR